MSLEDSSGEEYYESGDAKKARKDKLLELAKETPAYVKAPGYAHPIPAPAYVLQERNEAGRPESKYVDWFGCKMCSWSGTEDCPFGVGVKFEKGVLKSKHVNGICKKRIEYVKDLVGESKGKRMQTLQVMTLGENLELSNHMTKRMIQEAQEGEEFTYKPADIVAMKRLVSDDLNKIRRQDEGAKITHETKVKPSDVAKMVKSAKLQEISDNAVDVEVEEDEDN